MIYHVLSSASIGNLDGIVVVTVSVVRATILLIDPLTLASPPSSSSYFTHLRVLSTTLKVLAQRTYDAQLAGLHWGVSRHTCGYVLQVSGFSQKIDLLLQQVRSKRAGACAQ